MEGMKKKGKKKEQLTEELKGFLHESRTLHSKKSVMQIAKFSDKKGGELPKGVQLIWRGGRQGEADRDQIAAVAERDRQFEEDRLRQERHSRAAEAYVGPMLQRDEVTRGTKHKKLLRADPGWQESVRPLWTKGATGADVESLLREAEMADRLSSQALHDADNTRQKVLSRGGSMLGGGSVAGGSRAGSVAGGSVLSYRVPRSRPPTASTILSRAVGGGVEGEEGGGRPPRPHSSIDSGVDPLTLVPFAAPFGGGSAYQKLQRPASRAVSPGPPRPSSAHIKLPNDPSMGIEERYEMMMQPGSYYHRKRTDITSKRQTRAGFGKKKGWEDEIRKPVQQERVLGLDDLADKRKRQSELARGIAEAAARPPQEVPIRFEPQHSAIAVKRGVGEDWGFTQVYLPAAFARWAPGNKDPPYVNHVRDRPSWGVHGYSN